MSSFFSFEGSNPDFAVTEKIISFTDEVVDLIIRELRFSRLCESRLKNSFTVESSTG